MKWASRKSTYEQFGNYRVVRKFLWFPISLNSGQCRWLEFAFIYQRTEFVLTVFGTNYKWVDISFVKPEDIKQTYRTEDKNDIDV